MASLIYDKKKKRYRVSYYECGKRQRRFFLFKLNAQDFWKQMQFREERLEANLPHIDPILFKEAVELFKSQYLITKTKTYQISEERRLAQLFKAFEGKWLADLDKTYLDQYVVERLRLGVSHKTITNDLSILSTLFKWAISRNFARENPVNSVNKPVALPRRTRRALTDEEVSRILARSCLCCYPYLMILFNTGVRIGELVTLKKSDFDLDQHILTLRHTEDTPLKGKRDRIIPLNDAVEKIVRRMPEGRIMRFSRWKLADHFTAICKRAEVDACLHELRHTYVSALVSSGVDLITAKRFSGHTETKTLEKYLHWTGKGLEQVRNQVHFSVPCRCPKGEPERKIWENRAPYGHHDFLKNQLTTRYQRVVNASPTGVEPVLPP